MAAKRKVSWEPRARKAEKDLHRMERLRAELSTTLELVTRERDALLAANTELQAVAKAAQETAQTYAHRFHQMEDKNVELDAEADRLKRTDTELREEVRRLRKEAADHPAVVEKLQAELKAERHRVAELRQKNDGQLAQVQALREQVKEAAWEEAWEAWKGGVRAVTQSRTQQTAPQTFRCSDVDARVASLERTRGIHETALIALETKVAAMKGGG